ncbi:MAG: TonB-dependent receptor plug domain-containing protein, partial [Alphaproteobacteria bacterium]|nr:TonB-dependent receptor plug domain-containing protein [Alphaproteobacteria bacterium]
MSNNKITKIFFLIFLLPYIAYANNNVVQQNKIMEKIMVIGNQKKAISASSSAHFISKDQLEKNEYSDINRVLKVIPGVILQEEEGYGNRPNISFRGGRSERSADINIME